MSTLTLCSLFYVLGVWLSKNFDAGLLIIFALCLIISTTLVAIFKKRLNIFAILMAIFLIFGSVRFLGGEGNRFLYEFDDKYITVTGYINSTPDITDGVNPYRYTLRAETVTYGGDTYKLNQDILLNTNEEFAFGDRVTAFGHLMALSEKANENEYDFSLYYKSKGIFARLVTESADKTGERFSLSPMFWIGKLRAHIFYLCETYFSPDTSAFLRAIILGDKSGFTKEFLTLLVTSGLSHVLYAPFIHITLIYLIIGALRISKASRRDIWVIFVLILYALFSSGASNVIKAAALCGIMLFRRNIFGFSNKLDVLALIVLVLTIIDPYLCFNSCFCMSTISTVLVYASYPTIFKAISGKFRRRTKRNTRIAQLYTFFVIFTIGNLPFSAYFFNGMSIYSVFLTSLLMPIILLILTLSPIMFVSLTIFGASPILSEIMEKLAEILARIPFAITKLPFHYLRLETPDLLDFICFYLAWYLFLLIVSKRTRKMNFRVTLVLLLAFMLSGVNSYSFNTLSINFVNVGQGDAAILRTTAGDTVLIDGGGSEVYQSGYNIGEEVYLPYLVSLGIRKVDVAILSHYHQDHAQGIIAALENLKVDTLILPDYDAAVRKELLALANEKGTRICYFAPTDEIKFRSGLTLSCIAPSKNQATSHDENDASLVFKISYGKFCALFGGDSNDKLNENYPRDVDLLKVSHHGSSGSSNEEFLEYTSPEYAVISVGEDNIYGHPTGEVLLRLAEQNTQILRTDKMGDIRFKIKKNGHITFTALRPSY